MIGKQFTSIHLSQFPEFQVEKFGLESCMVYWKSYFRFLFVLIRGGFFITMTNSKPETPINLLFRKQCSTKQDQWQRQVET